MHQQLEFCMDIMFINKIGLMVSIDRTLRCCAVEPIKFRRANILLMSWTRLSKDTTRQASIYVWSIVTKNLNL